MKLILASAQRRQTAATQIEHARQIKRFLQSQNKLNGPFTVHYLLIIGNNRIIMTTPGISRKNLIPWKDAAAFVRLKDVYSVTCTCCPEGHILMKYFDIDTPNLDLDDCHAFLLNNTVVNRHHLTDVSECAQFAQIRNLLTEYLPNHDTIYLPEYIVYDPLLYNDHAGITYSIYCDKCLLPTVNRATVAKLLERLVDLRFYSENYTTIFLQTYKNFMNENDLMHFLKQIFYANYHGAAHLLFFDKYQHELSKIKDLKIERPKLKGIKEEFSKTCNEPVDLSFFTEFSRFAPTRPVEIIANMLVLGDKDKNDKEDPDKPDEKANEKPDEKPGDNLDEKPNEKPDEELDAKPNEKPDEELDEKLDHQATESNNLNSLENLGQKQNPPCQTPQNDLNIPFAIEENIINGVGMIQERFETYIANNNKRAEMDGIQKRRDGVSCLAISARLKDDLRKRILETIKEQARNTIVDDPSFRSTMVLVAFCNAWKDYAGIGADKKDNNNVKEDEPVNNEASTSRAGIRPAYEKLYEEAGEKIPSVNTPAFAEWARIRNKERQKMLEFSKSLPHLGLQGFSVNLSYSDITSDNNRHERIINVQHSQTGTDDQQVDKATGGGLGHSETTKEFQGSIKNVTVEGKVTTPSDNNSETICLRNDKQSDSGDLNVSDNEIPKEDSATNDNCPTVEEQPKYDPTEEGACCLSIINEVEGKTRKGKRLELPIPQEGFSQNICGENKYLIEEGNYLHTDDYSNIETITRAEDEVPLSLTEFLKLKPRPDEEYGYKIIPLSITQKRPKLKRQNAQEEVDLSVPDLSLPINIATEEEKKNAHNERLNQIYFPNYECGNEVTVEINTPNEEQLDPVLDLNNDTASCTVHELSTSDEIKHSDTKSKMLNQIYFPNYECDNERLSSDARRQILNQICYPHYESGNDVTAEINTANDSNEEQSDPVLDLNNDTTPCTVNELSTSDKIMSSDTKTNESTQGTMNPRAEQVPTKQNKSAEGTINPRAEEALTDQNESTEDTMNSRAETVITKQPSNSNDYVSLPIDNESDDINEEAVEILDINEQAVATLDINKYCPNINERYRDMIREANLDNSEDSDKGCVGQILNQFRKCCKVAGRIFTCCGKNESEDQSNEQCCCDCVNKCVTLRQNFRDASNLPIRAFINQTKNNQFKKNAVLYFQTYYERSVTSGENLLKQKASDDSEEEHDNEYSDQAGPSTSRETPPQIEKRSERDLNSEHFNELWLSNNWDALGETITSATILRNLQILKMWITLHKEDFENKESLRNEASNLVNSVLADVSVQSREYDAAVQVLNLLDECVRMSEIRNVPTPQHLSINIDSSIRDLAEELYMSDYQILLHLSPTELLNWSLSRGNMHKKTPYIALLIERFNQSVDVIIESIQMQENAIDRARVIVRWTEYGEYLLHLRNFNGLMQLCYALANKSIMQLSLTWSFIPTPTLIFINRLNDIVSEKNNYQYLRRAQENCSEPCIPFIGMYLNDLVSIEIKYETMCEMTGMARIVNFNKMHESSNIVSILRHFQMHGNRNINRDNTSINHTDSSPTATSEDSSEYKFCEEVLI